MKTINIKHTQTILKLRVKTVHACPLTSKLRNETLNLKRQDSELEFQKIFESFLQLYFH